MAAPVVASVATSTDTDTTITVTMPSGVSSGDLLVVAISLQANRTITSVPTGWTLFSNDIDSASVSRLATYYRIADGSEGGAVDWSLNSGTNSNISALRITGVDATTPVNVSAASAAGSTSVSPSVTTTAADCLLLRIFHMGRDRTFTAPSAHTEQTEITTGLSCDHSTATISQSSAGSSGTATWTLGGGGNDRSIHHVLGIAPTSGGGVVGPLLAGHLTHGGILTRGRLIYA